jgi:hypothetical protein
VKGRKGKLLYIRMRGVGGGLTAKSSRFEEFGNNLRSLIGKPIAWQKASQHGQIIS